MKHPRPDYNRIQDPLPESKGGIPADEPVFLLRAQDIKAPSTIRHWAEQILNDGGDPAMVANALEQARLMEAWPLRKLPDLPKKNPIRRKWTGPGYAAIVHIHKLVGVERTVIMHQHDDSCPVPCPRIEGDFYEKD